MDLSYPIGKFEMPEELGMPKIQDWINDVTAAPEQLRKAVAGLSHSQLDTPYRLGGWTLRQVVHHLPDTHLVTYMNFRTALSEDNPLMRSLDINASAELPDSKSGDVHVSLDLFEAVQNRWAVLLRALTFADFQRTLRHPSGAERTLAVMLGIYAWHGKHHVAQITSLRESKGW